MTMYRVTAIAHNSNFFINPDRVVFTATQEDNIDDYAFAHKCEAIAKKLTGIDSPFEMWMKEV